MCEEAQQRSLTLNLYCKRKTKQIFLENLNQSDTDIYVSYKKKASYIGVGYTDPKKVQLLRLWGKS